MLKAVLEKARTFRMAECAQPVPGPGEALLRPLAVGLCGSDLHLFREAMIGGVSIEEAGAEFVPGHECSARVEAVGPGVDTALVGKRVAVDPAMPCGKCRVCRRGWENLCTDVHFVGCPPDNGLLQEYICLPSANLRELPDELDDDAGMMLEPLGVALHAMDVGQVKPGASALVLGSGSIGLCCTMLLAKMNCAPIIATDLLDYRLDVAREIGATQVLNPNRDDVAAAAVQLTGGEGPEYVFECAGDVGTQHQMIDAAAVGAKVLVLGVPEGKDELAFRHSAARRKGLSILMVRRCNVPLERIMKRALEDQLPLSRLVTHHFPLEKVQEAFETLAGYRDGVVKAVVRP
jgi:L-iditol 2-dehydrogenase